MNKSAFAMGWLAGIEAVVVIAFTILLGEPVSAQQQTMSADAHHPDNDNQSGSSSNAAQQQHNATASTGMVMMNQTYNTTWMSLISGVKVAGISIIDNEHIAVNLRYDGEGPPPGASVIVVGMTNSSSSMMMGTMMQHNSMMVEQQREMRGMIMANNQQSNSSGERPSQQHQQHQNSSTLATNSSIPILSMQSGSNYLEAGWQGQESNSATVLVQLDSGIPGAHIMVMVFPFLHH
jgi:hypothetical protein